MNKLWFADDIVLINSPKQQLVEMLKDLNRKSSRMGIKINIRKTKSITPEPGDMQIIRQQIEEVNE